MKDKIILGDTVYPTSTTTNGQTVRGIHSRCGNYLVHVLDFESSVVALKLYKVINHNYVHAPMPLSVAKAALGVVGVDTLDVDLALHEDGSYVVTECPQRFATKVAAYFFSDSTIYHLDDWNGERFVLDMAKGEGSWTLQRFKQCKATKLDDKDARDVLRHLCVNAEDFITITNFDKLIIRGTSK